MHDTAAMGFNRGLSAAPCITGAWGIELTVTALTPQLAVMAEENRPAQLTSHG